MTDAKNPYFVNSQKVKDEIKSNSSILENVAKAFREETEPFTGASHDFYRIGMLESGVYVVMRVLPSSGSDIKALSFNGQINLMEQYCQNAEYLSSNGERVPNFCVGALCENKAGILMEDLTANDSVELIHHPDNAHGYIVQGSDKIKVFVDIDAQYRFTLDIKKRYFSNKAAIKIKTKGKVE